MALLFMEGFEQYASGGELTSTNYQAQSAMPVRWGGNYSAGINSAIYRTAQPGGVSKSLHSANWMCYAHTINPANLTNAFIGFAYYGPMGTYVMSMCNSISYVGPAYIPNGLYLYVTGAGALSVINGVNGATLLTTLAGVVSANVWAYIEVNFVYGAAGSLTIRVDGIEVGTVSGISTTCSVPATGWPYVNFGGPTGGYYDDIYICDNTTGSNNTFMNFPNVYTLFPDAAGAQTNLTPTGAANNYECVNAPSPNGTKYVSTSSANVTDLYGIESMVATPANVLAVAVSSYSMKTDNGPRQIKNQLYSGGTTVEGVLSSPMNNSYRRSVDIFLTQPGGAAWDLAGLTGLQIGIKTS